MQNPEAITRGGRPVEDLWIQVGRFRRPRYPGKVKQVLGGERQRLAEMLNCVECAAGLCTPQMRFLHMRLNGCWVMIARELEQMRAAADSTIDQLPWSSSPNERLPSPRDP